MTHIVQCYERQGAFIQTCLFCRTEVSFYFHRLGFAEYSAKCSHVTTLHSVERVGKAIEFKSYEFSMKHLKAFAVVCLWS